MDSISLFSQNSARLMSPRTQTRNLSGPSSPTLKRTFGLFKTARFPSDVVEIPKKKKSKSQADTRSYDSFSNLSFSSLNFYTEPNEETNSSILFSNLEDSAQNVKNEYLTVLSTVSDTLGQSNSKEIKKNDSNILKNLLNFSSPKHQKNNFFLDKIMDSDSESLPNPIPKKYVNVDFDSESYFSDPVFYRRLYEKRKRNYSKSNKISKIAFDSDSDDENFVFEIEPTFLIDRNYQPNFLCDVNNDNLNNDTLYDEKCIKDFSFSKNNSKEKVSDFAIIQNDKFISNETNFLRSNNAVFREQLNLLINQNKKSSTTKERDIKIFLKDDEENENLEKNNNNEDINNPKTFEEEEIFNFNENKVLEEEEESHFEKIENGNNENKNENINNNLLIFEEEEESLNNNENIFIEEEEEESFNNENVEKEEIINNENAEEEIYNNENVEEKGILNNENAKEEEIFNNENIIEEEEEDNFNNENIVGEEEEAFNNKENIVFEEEEEKFDGNRSHTNKKEDLFNVQQKFGLIEKEFFSDPSFDNKVKNKNKNKNKTDSNEKEENHLYKISSWPKIIPLIDYFQFKEKIISLTDVNNQNGKSNGNKDNKNNNSNENNNDNQSSNDNDASNNNNENDNNNNLNIDENQNNDNNQNNQGLNNSNLNETEFIFPLNPVFKCPPLFERTIRNTIKITATAKNIPKNKPKLNGFNTMKKSPYFEDYNGVLSFVKTEHPEFSDEPPFQDFKIKDIKKTIGWPNKDEKVKNRSISLNDEFKSPPKKIDKNNLNSNDSEIDDFYDFNTFKDNENFFSDHKNGMKFRSNSVLSSDLFLSNFDEFEEEEEEVDNRLFRSASVLSSDLFLSDFEASDLSLSSDEEEIIFDVNIPNETSFRNINNEKIDSSEMKSTINHESYNDKNTIQECFDIKKFIQPSSFISTDKERKYKDKFLVLNKQEKENFLILKNNEFKINQQSEIYFTKKILFPSIFLIPFLNYKEQILIDFVNNHQFDFFEKNNKDSFSLKKINAIENSDSTFLSIFPISDPFLSISKDNFNVCIEMNKNKNTNSTDSNMYNTIKFQSTSSDTFIMKIDNQKDISNSDSTFLSIFPISDPILSISKDNFNVCIETNKDKDTISTNSNMHNMIKFQSTSSDTFIMKIDDQKDISNSDLTLLSTFPISDPILSISKDNFNVCIETNKDKDTISTDSNMYNNIKFQSTSSDTFIMKIDDQKDISNSDLTLLSTFPISDPFLSISKDNFNARIETNKDKDTISTDSNMYNNIKFQSTSSDTFIMKIDDQKDISNSDLTLLSTFPISDPILSISKDNFNVCIETNKDKDTISTDSNMHNMIKFHSTSSDTFIMKIDNQKDISNSDPYMFKKDEYKSILLEDLIFIDEYEFLNLECCDKDENYSLEDDFVPAHSLKEIADEDPFSINKQFIAFPKPNQFSSLAKKELNNYLIKNDKYLHVDFPKGNKYYNLRSLFDVSNSLNYSTFDKLFDNNKVQSENFILSSNETFSVLKEDDKTEYLIKKSDNFVDEIPFQNKYSDLFQNFNQPSSYALKTNPKTFIHFIFGSPFLDLKQIFLSKEIDNQSIKCNYSPLNHEKMLSNIKDATNKKITYNSSLDKFYCNENKKEKQFFIEDPNDSFVKQENDFGVNQIKMIDKTQDMISKENLNFPSSSSFISNSDKYSNRNNMFISSQAKFNQITKTEREFNTNEIKDEIMVAEHHKNNVNDALTLRDKELYNTSIVIQNPFSNTFVSNDSIKYKNRNSFFISIQAKTNQKSHIYNEFQNEIFDTNKYLALTKPETTVNDCLIHQKEHSFNSNEFLRNPSSSSTFISNDLIQYHNKNNKFISTEAKTNDNISIIVKRFNEFTNDEADIKVSVSSIKHRSQIHDKHSNFDKSSFDVNITLINISSSSFVSNDTTDYQNKSNTFVSNQIKSNEYKPTRQEFDEFQNKDTEINKSLPSNVYKASVLDSTNKQNSFKSNEILKYPSFSLFVSYVSKDYKSKTNSFNSFENTDKQLIKTDKRFNEFINTETKKCLPQTNLKNKMKSNLIIRDKNIFYTNEITNNPKSSSFVPNDFQYYNESEIIKETIFNTNNSIKYTNKINLFISEQDRISNQPTVIEKGLSEFGNDEFEVNKTILLPNHITNVCDLSIKQNASFISNNSMNYKNKENYFISTQSQKNQKEKNSYHSLLTNKSIPFTPKKNEVKDISIHQNTKKLNQNQNFKISTSSSFISNVSINYMNGANSFTSIQSKNNEKYYDYHVKNNQKNVNVRIKCNPLPQHKSKINDGFVRPENKLNKIDNLKTKTSSTYVSNNLNDYSNKNTSFNSIPNQFNNNQISLSHHKPKTSDEFIKQENKRNKVDDFMTQTSSPYISNESDDYSNKNNSFISVQNQLNNNQMPLSKHKSKTEDEFIKQENKLNKIDNLKTKTSSPYASNESKDYSNKNNSFISNQTQFNNNRISLSHHKSKANDEFIKQENKLNKIDNLKAQTSSSYISNDSNGYSNKNTSFISNQHQNNKKEKSLSQFNNNQMRLRTTSKFIPQSQNKSKINDEHINQENKINTIENFKTQTSSSYTSNLSNNYSNKNNSFISVHNQLNNKQISSPQHKSKVNDEYINQETKLNTTENFKTKTSSPYVSNGLNDYSNKNTSFISIRPYYNKEEQNSSHLNNKQMHLPITNKSINQEIKFNRTDAFKLPSSSSFNDSINCKNNLDPFVSNQTNYNQKMDSFDMMNNSSNHLVPLSKNTAEIKDRSIQQKDNKSISMEYFITPTPLLVSFNKYHNVNNTFHSIQSNSIPKDNDYHIENRSIKLSENKPEIEDEMINQKENKYSTIEILQMPSLSTFISIGSFKYINQVSSFVLAHSHNNLVSNEFQNTKFDNIKSISTTNYSSSIHDFQNSYQTESSPYLSENISFTSKKENKSFNPQSSFLSNNEFEKDNSKYSFDSKNESAKSPLMKSKIQSRSFKQKENEKKAIKSHNNISSSNLSFHTKQDSYSVAQNEFKTNETKNNSNLFNSEFNINKNNFCVLDSFNSFISTGINTTSYKLTFEDESFKPNVIKIKSTFSPSTYPDFFNPTQNQVRNVLISDLAVESDFDNYNIFNSIFEEYEEEEEEEDIDEFVPIDYSSMSLFRSDSEEEEKDSSEEIIRFGPINVIKKEIININDIVPKPKLNQSTQTNKEKTQSINSENSNQSLNSSTKKSTKSSQSKRIRRRRPKKKQQQQQQKDTNKIKSKQNSKKQQVKKNQQKEDESVKSKQKESEKVKKKQTESESKPIKHYRRHNMDSISRKNDHPRDESESKSNKRHIHHDADSISSKNYNHRDESESKSNKHHKNHDTDSISSKNYNHHDESESKSSKHHRRHDTDSISGSSHHHKQRSNSRSSQKQKEVVTFPTSILKNPSDRSKTTAKENSKIQNIQPKRTPQLKIVNFAENPNIQKENEHHVTIHEAVENSEETQIKKFITNPSDKKLNNEMNVKFAFSEVLNDDSKPFIIHKKDSISYKMFYRSLALPLVPTENENFSLLLEKVSEPLRLNRQFETLLEFLENYMKEKDASWVDLYPLNTSNIIDRYPLIYGELIITKFNGEKKKEITRNCKLLVDGTFLFDYPFSMKSSGNKKSKKSEESESKEQKNILYAIKNCSIKETKNKKCLLIKSNDNNNSNFLNQNYDDISIEIEGIQFIDEIEIKSNNKELISQWLSINDKLREKRSLIEYYISLLAFYSFYDLNSYRLDRTEKFEDGSSVNWTQCEISDDIIEKSVLSPNLYLPLFVLNHPNNDSKIVNCLFNLFVKNNRHDFLIRTLILGEISTTPSKLIFQIPTIYNRSLLVLFTSPSIEWINSFAEKIENVSISPSIFLKMLLKEMNQMKQESVYIIRSVLFLSFLVFGDSCSSFKVFILFLKSAILNVINNKKTEKTIQSFFAQIQIQVVDPKTKEYQRLYNFTQSLLLKKPILSKEYTFNDKIIGQYNINTSQICKSILVFVQENDADFIEFMEKKIINLNEEKKNINEIHPLFFSFYQNVRFYLIKPYKDQVPIHS